MVKVDLHTHSVASPDGGLSLLQYKHALETSLLDCIAVTDHNRIDFALDIQQELGEAIIIGEEIMTSGGEIIGLFLTEVIQPGLSPLQTVKLIKDQGGLVYIPHPFETFRKGLHPQTLEELINYIDMLEICNGRAFFQNRSQQAVVWARLNHKPGIASSDAHGFRGLGKTYMNMDSIPNADLILGILKTAALVTERPSWQALLYPKYNRFRKNIRGSA